LRTRPRLVVSSGGLRSHGEDLVDNGQDVRVGEPADLTEAPRLERVPLASVPQMIDAGEIWNAGSLVALSRVILKRLYVRMVPSQFLRRDPVPTTLIRVRVW
jgi:hypothetical protein